MAPLPFAKIQDLCGESEKRIQQGIEELKRKDLLIFKTDSQGHETFQAPPVFELEQKFHEPKGIFSDFKKIIEPRLHSSGELGITKYNGWEGIRYAYEEILKEAIKTQNSFFSYETNIVNQMLGEKFVKKFIEKRKKARIKAFVICPFSKEDVKYREEYCDKYTKIRLVKGINFPANINIVGHKVLTFSINPPQGTIRNDIAEADTQRSIFWDYWRRLPVL